MDKDRHSKISKFLSYVLRHKPEKIGIKLGEDGWVDVKELIEKSKKEIVFDFNELKEVVKNCDKQRFSFSEDFCEIRVNSGFSVDIELNLIEVLPPEFLFHGTLYKNINSIFKDGLTKQKRHHVHMSPDIETSKVVANRRNGKKAILKIDAQKMNQHGEKIYKVNNIYFSDNVKPQYIQVLEVYD